MTPMEEALKIAEQTNYLNKSIEYLKNVTITEYDIKSAGFSVLKFLKLLPDETLQKWEKLDKQTRTVKEGLLQKEHPEIAEKILKTLSSARQAFVILNKIRPEDILAIKKDAIFLINKQPTKLIIKEFFEFRKKNTYTSYMYINKKEFYFSSLTKELEVKGISNEAKILQKDYLLKYIGQIFASSEKVNPEQLFTLLKSFRRKYLNRELPIENYRNLLNGKYQIGNFSIDNLPEEDKGNISITENYINFILPMFQILL